MNVKHSRVQHGVGQGSFHSATVEVEAVSGRYRFDYVYDCGALASYGRQTPGLKNALGRISLEPREMGASKAVLDLMVLSHFDADHMNGARTLVDRFEVDRIVLPYLGIDELALVIASQADVFNESTVVQLHGLANGSTTLLGRPVTMVKTEPRNAEDRALTDEPQSTLEERAEPPPVQEFPRRASVVIEGSDASPGVVMSDEENLIIKPSDNGVHRTWKLRFWNRGLDPVLSKLIRQTLNQVGFPIAALHDRHNGAQTIITWLKVKHYKGPAKKGHGGKKASGPRTNRDLAVAAYREAIEKYKPTWLNEVTGKKLENFLSVGLYSGPGFDFKPEDLGSIGLHENLMGTHLYRHLASRQMSRAGWIGTGDAPLGEPLIWQDFETHYKVELALTQTVLVPHHGAAPTGGTRFYNRGLNPHSWINSVISYGSRNTHGHPHPSVLAGIAYANGRLLLVNENTPLGFQEIHVFERSLR